MLLIDANLLIYAFRRELPQHEPTRSWLVRQLPRQDVGVPTLFEVAFLRLTTKSLGPLGPATWQEAWSFITALLGYRRASRVQPGPRHHLILHQLMTSYALSGDQVVDAWLAAIALEQDATMASADKGFARFGELRWINPLDPP